jgi:hypothetical protein
MDKTTAQSEKIAGGWPLDNQEALKKPTIALQLRKSFGKSPTRVPRRGINPLGLNPAVMHPHADEVASAPRLEC